MEETDSSILDCRRLARGTGSGLLVPCEPPAGICHDGRTDCDCNFFCAGVLCGNSVCVGISEGGVSCRGFGCQYVGCGCGRTAGELVSSVWHARPIVDRHGTLRAGRHRIAPAAPYGWRPPAIKLLLNATVLCLLLSIRFL